MKSQIFMYFKNYRTKNTQKKIYLALVISIITITITISCQSKVVSDIPVDLLDYKAIPSLDATDLETTYTDSGVVRYHIKTPRVLDFASEKIPFTEFPEGFHLQQFDKNKKIISELSANYGKNFKIDGKWLATGNVVLVNNKGDTLRTEELNYLEKENLIFTDKFVNIKKGDQDFNGSGGFKSDTQMTKWSFIGTKGHVYMEDK